MDHSAGEEQQMRLSFLSEETQKNLTEWKVFVYVTPKKTKMTSELGNESEYASVDEND